jgi:hypothetical protein
MVEISFDVNGHKIKFKCQETYLLSVKTDRSQPTDGTDRLSTAYDISH